jgi:hypothetical protein
MGCAKTETERHRVFLQIDKLQIELPRSRQADPASAGIVQDLLAASSTSQTRDIQP